MFPFGLQTRQKTERGPMLPAARIGVTIIVSTDTIMLAFNGSLPSRPQ
jgi:hypothetical protein